MKKILFSFLSLCAFSVIAQSYVYKPFPTTYGNWQYENFDGMGNPTGGLPTYELNGDTTISSINYKKISTNTLYSGALREVGKIIYFIPADSLNEVVLYNFNLIEDDTIIHPYGGASCSFDTVTVDLVDTILSSDGSYKTRVFYFSSLAIWVEGVGSMNYLLRPYDNLCLSGNDWLRCMYADSSLRYYYQLSNCAVSVANEVNADNITIYPNPSQGSFNIRFSGDEIREILISDLTGRLVVQQNINHQAEINVQGLAAGTYILTSIDKDQKRSTLKIISTK